VFVGFMHVTYARDIFLVITQYTFLFFWFDSYCHL